MTDIQKKEHYKYLFSVKEQVKTDEKLVSEILDKHLNNIPNKKLYKYRTCNDDNFTILKENCIWMPPAKKFKDVFDSSINIDLEKNAKEIEEWLNGNFLKLYFQYITQVFRGHNIPFDLAYEDMIKYVDTCVRKDGTIDEEASEHLFIEYSSLKDQNQIELYRYMISEVHDKLENSVPKIQSDFCNLLETIRNNQRNTMLIYCLTEEYDNPSLWENYSDNYQGFCIEYSFENYQNAPFDVYKNLIYLMPMSYCKEKPYFDMAPILDKGMRQSVFKEEGLEDDPDMIAQLNMQMIYKDIHYEYEKEWRFSIKNENNNKQCFPFVSAIYAGKDISDDNLKTLFDISNKLSVPLFRQEINKSKNGYTYTPVKETSK